MWLAILVQFLRTLPKLLSLRFQGLHSHQETSQRKGESDMDLEINIPANNAYLRIPLTLEAIELAKKFLELNKPKGE